MDTIKIKSPNPRTGYAIINAVDFDPKTMTKFGEEEKKKAPAPKAPAKGKVKK